MNTRQTTLAGILWTEPSLAHEVMLVLAGSLFVGLSAQLVIPLPFSPVPVTGQTFGVLLVGASLGSRRGGLSLLAYLGEGLLGLPVFAGGNSGLARVAGPTGGYLVGFVVAAFVVGWLCERGWDRRLFTAGAAMLLGNAIIYLFGLPWLSRFVGTDQVLAQGLLPFLPGDILKLILAGLSLPTGWAVVYRLEG